MVEDLNVGAEEGTIAEPVVGPEGAPEPEKADEEETEG